MPDLALLDDRALVVVHDLDRVLDRHDVRAPVRLMWPIIEAIVVVLPVPVGPGDQHQPAGESASVGHHGREHRARSNVGTSERTRGSRGPPRTLTEHVDPEAPDAGERVAEVGLARGLELARLCSGISARAAASVSAADMAPNAVGLSSPSTRTNGTLPAFRCRSLAPTSTVCRSSSVISTCLLSLPLVLGLDLLEVLFHLSAPSQDL